MVRCRGRSASWSSAVRPSVAAVFEGSRWKIAADVGAPDKLGEFAIFGARPRGLRAASSAMVAAWILPFRVGILVAERVNLATLLVRELVDARELGKLRANLRSS